jgi:hypothetical protein
MVGYFVSDSFNDTQASCTFRNINIELFLSR